MVPRGINEWNIQSRARVCQSCGHGFADGQVCHSLLFEQRHGYERLDVCAACWDAQHSQGATDRKGFVSHWQGLFTAPPPPPPEPIQRDNAEELLRRLVELNDAAWQSAAFILAVMLERKRLLKVKDQIRRDGRRVFIYESARSGEVFFIADPELQLDRLDEVQQAVAQLIEHGVPGARPAQVADREQSVAADVTTETPAQSGP